MNATENEVIEYRIADWALEDLTARFAKLAKRANKLGVPAPSFTIVRTEEVPEYGPGLGFEVDGALEPTGRMLTWHYVTVEGTSPKYDGWSMIAVVDRDLEEPDAPNVVNVVGEHEPDVAWRHLGDVCDYCAEHNNTHPRGRKTLVVVEHDDSSRKVVGTTCLRDFLGHRAPSAIANWIEILSSLPDLLAAYGEEEDGERGVFSEVRWVPEFYLALVALSIRTTGWCSRTSARNSDGYRVATADDAIRIDDDNRYKSKIGGSQIKPADEDKVLAAAALEWAQDIDVDIDNDYLANVAAIARKSGWRHRDLGVGASIVFAYQREQEREVKRQFDADAFANSQWFGEIKQRLDISGTVTSTRWVESMYGSSLLVTILTDDGNVVKWFASNPPAGLEVVGTHVSGKATIKKHDEYNEVKQTVVTRASLVVTPSK